MVDNDRAAELYSKRTDIVESLAALDAEIAEVYDELDRHHTSTEAIEWQDISPWIPSLTGSPIRWKPLVMPELGFKVHAFYSFMLQIPPGHQGGKYHVHGEAIKFYLKGRGIEHIGDKTYEVKAGDFVLIPANTWHGTQNPYDEPIEIYGVQMKDGNPLPIPVEIASNVKNDDAVNDRG